MLYLNSSNLFHLYTNEKVKQPLISDRIADELVRIANKQLVGAKWVVKDRSGKIVRSYNQEGIKCLTVTPSPNKL